MPELPRAITHAACAPEGPLLDRLTAEADLSEAARARIVARAADLVRGIRDTARPGLMEVFLAEYGLSTDEGIALMCLAEALLRVPDAETMDRLIEDKIAPSDWGQHLGRSASPLVNASTWALMLTGKVLEDGAPGVPGSLRGALRRLGEPVIRRAVARAMQEMGRQFVLGETIDAALQRAAAQERLGYGHSYDMLGEAARTDADARRYHAAYAAAIAALARVAPGADVRANPGISVKLSALHPRHEYAQRARLAAELVPRVQALARSARAANLGFNIDAEEADRLVPSLEVIAAVLEDPALAGWDGFGVVVQAYGRRAGPVIDWLHDLAGRLDRRLMVRLVKGAYWDSEIKRAQVLGLADFPVLTRKPATDVSYIALARRLLGMTDRLYPQFATHNAHTVAAILEMAPDPARFEFQRLHGMGEALHEIVRQAQGTRCRIYAPVGAHRDLLAYLVRRLLENGANSSFVHQVVNRALPAEAVAACPFAALQAPPRQALPRGPELFADEPPAGRRNSAGHDLSDPGDLARLEAARAPWQANRFAAGPMLAVPPGGGARTEVMDPARAAGPDAVVGTVTEASERDVARALAAARPWTVPPAERAAALRRAADLYEAETGPFLALLAREAGKTLPDAVSELREAVDFLRYYANGARDPARGVFACISPWNFPLAIFTGQVAAALAAGNAVLAKPAEQTPLVAAQAVALLHRAGVPRPALQLLPGPGGTVGATLTADARLAGVAFTGSTETARTIRRALAAHAPGAVLIAETGGINAMIVDSTALPEQAVRDVVVSAFQSAGQRCSALRCLYVQEEIAAPLQRMLFGAMDTLRLGDPGDLATDIGPLIDAAALRGIRAHIAAARAEGRVLHEVPAPAGGHFLGPTVIRIPGIAALDREVFGPVLHLATFRAEELDAVVAAVNATGYGLTFGLHSRIDDRVQRVVERIRAGNTYVNRNQIGAVVGSQPFGGEGLSGTGPKAGGPAYLARFLRADAPSADAPPAGAGPAPAPDHTARGAAPAATGTAGPDPAAPADEARLQAALSRIPVPQAAVATEVLPGPTGESNRLSLHPRGVILCLGPGPAAAAAQAAAVRAAGGVALAVAEPLDPAALGRLQGFAAAVWWGDPGPFQRALAARPGPILPLITERPEAGWVLTERHVCIDTTAAGGNARLLASVAD